MVADTPQAPDADQIGRTSGRLLQAAGVLAVAGATVAAAMLVSSAGSDRSPDFVTAEMPGLERPAEPSAGPAFGESLALTELRRGNEFYRGRSPKDLLRAEAAYLRATELDPTLAEAWGGLATTYAMMAEYPLRDRFELYHQARRGADHRPGMLTALDRAAELDPGNYVVHWYGWVIHWIRGEYDEAVPFLLQAFETAGRYEWAEELEAIYRERGFDGFLDAYGSVIPDHGNLIERARIALYFQKRDRALDLLEQAAANRDSELTWLATFPDLRELEDEPRFRVLLERVGGRV
ncbi:MAG: hypothetical protein MPN21_28410 [Thermoanaerobaculia bacterium]|nr:hypothetical protein [Thermoanaerobaculia bacterium]